MKTKIRVILTKKGYKVFEKVVKEWSESVLDFTINEETCKFYGDLVFIKWDANYRYKIYQTLVMLIKTYHITCRICFYDKGIIYMDQYTDPRDKNKNIPMPCIRCSFQDEKTEKLLNELVKNSKRG